jgi:hypothetical protein
MKAKTRPYDDHPDRDELLRAVKTGDVPFRRHLAVCDSCRSIYNFLLLRREVESQALPAPSIETFRRDGTLPLVAANWTPRRTEVGHLERDSWTGLPLTVTRDSAMGLERSLRFSAGTINLELVSDRTADSWRLAARCYCCEIASREFILKVGTKRLRPGLHDCYSWTSLKPPRTIQLLSPSLRLIFDTGIW